MLTKKLITVFNQLEMYIDSLEAINPAVSHATVGWHIKHCYLVFIKIVEFLNDSDPKRFEKKFSFKKLLIFASGRLPRGKAKAPKIVNPTEVNELELRALALEVKQAIKNLNKTKDTQFVTHPVFGDLNKKDAIRFMEIHTKHHIRIIKEILRK